MNTHTGIFIIVFYLFSFTMLGQDMSADFNGWEFLEWGTSVEDVQRELAERDIDFEPARPNQKLPATKFEYQEFETSLHYDDGLYDVQQYKYFEFSDRKHADEFFNNICNKLIENYGNPNSRHRNENDGKENLEWSLKHTNVNLVYWFGSEITILLQFNPSN
ncbi:MAG: hypothetical protein JW866_10785 [Ignavibacteriales bacterium]|nr:hypothetical protein [Ignavibacteriales bacterium]